MSEQDYDDGWQPPAEQQPQRGGQLDRLAAAAVPATRSQATAIEQSRAVAEVLASVELAMRKPRNLARSVRGMEEATALHPLALRSFWSFRRAGEQLTGSTIHLARELARLWENIAYGVAELDRDDAAAQSQMIAWAWDLESNVRSSTVFIVPHIRDTKRGPKPIVDLRDVYENNANMGARRVREQITAVIPRWFVDDAEERCRETLKRGPAGQSVPFPRRVANAIGLFESELRVRVEQLVEHVGRPVEAWSPVDLANLTILYTTLRNGEQRVDEVFDMASASSGAIREQAARRPRKVAAGTPAPPASGDDPTTDPAFGTEDMR